MGSGSYLINLILYTLWFQFFPFLLNWICQVNVWRHEPKKVHKQPSWQITDKNVYSVEMQIHADSSYNVSHVRAPGCKNRPAPFPGRMS